MYLYEILIALDGKPFYERDRMLKDMGVGLSLRRGIHACFDPTNKLIRNSLP